MVGQSMSVPRRPGPAGALPPVPQESDILRRGLSLFAELGYAGASARELAKRIGVNHNFVNDRYGSKAAFWRAVVDHALEAQLAEIPPPDPDADPAEQLRVFITTWYRTTVDRPEIGQLCLDEFSRDSDRLDYLYERFVRPTLDVIGPSVDELVAAGRMKALSRNELLFALIGPANGLVQVPLAHRLGRRKRASRAARIAVAERLAAFVLDGLLAGS